jgi:mono/diheme cytochrome c family protein
LIRPFLWAVAMLTLLAGMLVAQNAGYHQDPNWRAPVDATSRTNPLARKPEATAGGEKLFKRNCVECHGEDGSGVVKKNAADLLLPEVQSQSDGTLFWKLTNGNTDRGMPSFSRLPELQRWQLVLYLRTLHSVQSGPPKDSSK